VYRLALLGRMALETDDGPLEGRGVQRRRLAMLAVLALSRGSAAPRERIAALLWPEAPADRSRHQVSDSIYRINQTLGGPVITAVGDELRLDRTLLAVDAVEFGEAAEAGDWARCVSLYGGPLLDGCFIPDAAEFERWVDVERARLAQLYLKALEALAVAAGERGERSLAVDFWRRAAVQDPHSARLARQLMLALDLAGERAAAIRHARVHAELVRQEIGAEPDPSVVALAEQLASNQIPAAPSEGPRAVASDRVGENGLGDASRADAAPAAGGSTRQAPVSPEGASASRESAHEDRPGSHSSPTARSESSSDTRDGRETASGRAAAGATSPRRRWSVRWGAAAVVVVTALVGAWFASRTLDRSSASTPESVAVLPFANQSGDVANEYMSDGITDELISTLATVPGLRVASRTSAFSLKGLPLDVREVGTRLGVEAVLEGSVRRSGDRLRVTAQLVSAQDGYQLWSETFDRSATDVLAIQSEIARAIATRLGGGSAVDAGVDEHPQDDPVAYDLYLQGRYAWHQRTEAGLKRAVDRFEAAVARSPRYARAHAGLGDAYAVLAFYDYVAPREAFPKARDAARRAIALAPGLAAAHATLGYVSLYHDWQFERAEAEFRRAIALDSTYSVAHQWYGNLLTSRGRFDEAMREMRRAQELDPLSLIASAALGWIHLMAGQYDEAVAQCRRTLALDGEFALAWLWKGIGESELGRPDSARVALRRAAVLSGETGIVRAAIARSLALAGSPDSARAIIRSLERREGVPYAPSYEIAKVHLALGDRAAALTALERAVDERAHSLVFLAIDPQLAALRREPRFVALLERIQGDA
jgi:TolB-like protein/DNA-binding SARP family transcriptional activator/Flp pilus assembly protein TadD